MDHQEAVLVPGSRNARRHQQGVTEIVIFSVGSRLAVSSLVRRTSSWPRTCPCTGESQVSRCFRWKGYWAVAHRAKHFGLAGLPGANLPLGRKSGFGYSGCSQRAGRRSTWAIDRTGNSGRSAGFQTCCVAEFQVGRPWKCGGSSLLTLSSRVAGYCAAVGSVLPYDHDDHLTQIA